MPSVSSTRPFLAFLCGASRRIHQRLQSVCSISTGRYARTGEQSSPRWRIGAAHCLSSGMLYHAHFASPLRHAARASLARSVSAVSTTRASTPSRSASVSCPPPPLSRIDDVACELRICSVLSRCFACTLPRLPSLHPPPTFETEPRGALAQYDPAQEVRILKTPHGGG